MSRLGLALALVLPLSLASAASARDVCVDTSFGGVIVFKKVKSLKRPGSAVTLQGLYIQQGISAPVTGTAISRTDGSIALGLFLHTMQPIFGTNSTLLVVAPDDSFTAAGKYDGDGDQTADADMAFTAVDCKSVVIP